MYVFDLEGTLSNCAHRLHLYRDKEWLLWNNSFMQDEPRPEMVHLFNICQDRDTTIILTSKEDVYKTMVKEWLIKHEILPDMLVMKTKEHRDLDSPNFKLNYLIEIHHSALPIHMVFDDRKDVCEKLLNFSIPAIWVGDIYEK